MPEEPYYIFDPAQFKEFGSLEKFHRRFFEGDDFYYRCQFSKKFFTESICIPLGPNCKTKQGFENFLKHIESFKFKKVVIDLPALYSKEKINEITSKLKALGFKKTPYRINDEETLLVFKDRFNLNSKRMNKVRHGYKSVDIVLKEKADSKDIEEIYKIYLDSAKRIGFFPKPKDLFLKLNESALVSLAKNKETPKIEGYVFGYFFDCAKTDFLVKENTRILLIMFTGETDFGREHRIGHAMHYDLFKAAFEKYEADIIDFHGASRAKNKSYVLFKEDFSSQYYSLPGSFSKIYL